MDGVTEGSDQKTTAIVVPPQAPATNADVRPRVMLLGRLGAWVIAVDKYASAPAHAVADESIVIPMSDANELAEVIRRLRPDYVVTAADEVSAQALEGVGPTGPQLVPSARAVRLTADREGLRRLAADELGLPTAPFWFAGSVGELQAVGAHAGYPLLVKPVAGATPRGESVIAGPDDIEPVWQRVAGAQQRVLAETVVEVEFYVTLLAVRSEGPDGPAIEFCSPIGHRGVNADVQESWQPQKISASAMDAARSIAARIVKALGGRGVFGVELMINGDEVCFSDITARPFESGLVTTRTQRLSEFELQARAILGLPVDPIMISPGAAEVISAGGAVPGPQSGGALADALRRPESDVRVFSHDDSEARRPLGAAVVTAADVTAARSHAREVSTALRRLW